MALTGKKLLFADAVLAGKTNKEAAIIAGYSAKTASPAGSRLVKDKQVAAYLAIHRAQAESAAGEVAQPAQPAQPAPAPTEPEKPKPTFDLGKAIQHTDPKNFLIAAMNDIELGEKLRIDAAKALMPFMHAKKGESGKKEDAAAAAAKAGNSGRFASGAPPKLVVNNGK